MLLHLYSRRQRRRRERYFHITEGTEVWTMDDGNEDLQTTDMSRGIWRLHVWVVRENSFNVTANTERCNPCPHVANRHISITQLLQPTVNFWPVVTYLQFPIQVCFPYSVTDTSVTETFLNSSRLFIVVGCKHVTRQQTPELIRFCIVTYKQYYTL